jgi:septal ring factor EnvC (AmiA/AmiB activator)
VCLLSALPEVVTGILTFVASIAGPVAGIVTAVVFAVRRERKKALARVESEPPAAPRVPAQPMLFADPSITGKIHEANVSIARSEWALSELRDELRTCREERDQVAQDSRRTADALVRAEVDLRSALAKLATLEQSRDHWRGEAARLESEVERLSARQRVERVDPETIVTPLRPGPRRAP